METDKESLCSSNTFTRIFRDYSQEICNFLYYKCGEFEIARDITQEAFMKLWQNCSHVSLEKAKAYVFTTAHNQLKNIWSQKKVQLKFIEQEEIKNELYDPDFLLQEKEFADTLKNAISGLAENQRIVFLMSRIDKKTYNEIAEILGISRKAVEKRMYKALDNLRKISDSIK